MSYAYTALAVAHSVKQMIAQKQSKRSSKKPKYAKYQFLIWNKSGPGAKYVRNNSGFGFDKTLAPASASTPCKLLLHAVL